jgi:hypothetical protein
VVQRFYDEVFNKRDLAAIANIFDPNFAIHDLDVAVSCLNVVGNCNTLTTFAQHMR